MKITATFCCLLFSFYLFAQQQMGSYIAYGAEAKYFSNLNYKTYQSSKGYLWFGTLNGLVRFDGKRYKNYFSDYTNPNSPSDNTIFDITEDKNGDLWFAGFFHGVTRYNQQSGKFTKYPVLSKDKNTFYGIYKIMNDHQGNLWFGTSGRGLAKYHFEKDSFLLYYPEPSFSRDGTAGNYNFITSIAEDPTDSMVLWLGTFHGLFSFNKTDKKFRAYHSGIKTNTKHDILINALEFDTNGLLWIGSWGNGLACFNTMQKKYLLQKIKPSPGIVYDLKRVNDSIIYAACLNEGLYSLNIHTGKFINITPPRNAADLTSMQPNIQKVSLTPDAGIFVGGNYYVYQQHPAYTRLKKSLTFPSSVKTKGMIELNNFIWDEKRQQYWLATTDGNGLYSLDKTEKKLTPLQYDAGANNSIAYFHDLVKDALNRLWVLNAEGIQVWDENKNSFIKANAFIPLPGSVSKKIQRLAANPEGNIWMWGDNNFYLWDVRKNKMEVYPVEWDKAFNGETILKNSILLSSPDGSAWLLTSAGMFHCIPTKKQVKHIFKTGVEKTQLSSAVIRCAAFNKHDDLWLSSGNGIQVLKWENYAVRANHTIDKGLPSMNVNCIVTDTAGRVWAATAAGLGMFDTRKKIWQIFNRMDGFENDYLDGNIFITDNNKIVVDQKNGFLLKDINELVSGGLAPQLKLTAVFINKTEWKDSLLPEYLKKLDLSYDQNNIELEFAAMDWIYPFKTSYRYKIEGIASDSTWAPIPDCKINLTGLQHGKYVVHIRALNSSGNWSNELILPILIHPPFWKTGWFVSLFVLAVLFILYALYRYRINHLVQMQKVRNAISRDLHDEIGATLSSVNMLSAVALKKAGQNNEAQPIIEQIKDAVQQAGESMDDIVWSVNPANDKAADTFARIRKFTTELAELKGVNCKMDIEDPGEDLSLTMELRRDLYLICKEAVNNALKYANCSEINLAIRIQKKYLHLQISDNGKGFDTAVLPENKRNGIPNMKHRTQKHKGSFSIKSITGNGTMIDCLLHF
jgi:ligand-binding sensor domain-containing protein/two-component sensor histidine kinase